MSKSFEAMVWNTLSAIDVSSRVEKKGNLSFLSWAWAWGILMKHYPQSYYEFRDTEIHPDNTVTVNCVLTVAEGENKCHRSMWLPVMDNRNNSVIDPNSRKISDTKMRCLVKCMAMFGLGHYIYAGEDLPDPDSVLESITEKYSEIIEEIKAGIAGGDLHRASENWFTLDEEQKAELWKAKSKGGCFNAAERRVMQSKEFRESYFGEGENE